MTTALLKRQLEELGLSENQPPTVEQWSAFLTRASETYARVPDGGAAAAHSPNSPSEKNEGEPATWAKKRPDEVTALLQDLREKSVSVLQKNAAALAENLALANAVQESVADAIMVVGIGGRLLSMNRRFREMVTLPEELATTTRADVVLDYLKQVVKDPEQLKAMVRTSVDQPNQVYMNEIELKNGRLYERYVAPVPNRDGTLYGRVVCYRDVTERRRVDKERAVEARRIGAMKAIVEKMGRLLTMQLPEKTKTEQLESVVRELLYAANEQPGDGSEGSDGSGA